VRNKKSLLLLGSTGFLGSSILNLLKSEPLPDFNILISQSSPFNESIHIALLNPDFTGDGTFDATNLASVLNTELTVINCASSRNSKNEELSEEANYIFPKNVLDTLLDVNGIRITWVQIETFWQYSKGSTPDESYVLWKNRFGHLLTESSFHGNLLVERLVLPHLIGPFDNPFRFLPRLFSKILKGEGLQVEAPEEIFCLADVRDVAQYLVSLLSNSHAKQDTHSALFPFIEIQLSEIVDRFIKISGHRSRIEFVETFKNSNPALNLDEQPPLLDPDQLPLHDLDSTLSDIVRWLSGLQHVDNLS